jgi:carbon-monoxide dehydrogenase large subunit
VTHAAEPTGWIGRPLKRREDRTLVTGRGRFVDDLKIAGTLHLLLARSPHAHARIRSIDAGAARRTPGVVAVVLADDIGSIGPVPLMRLAPGTLVPDYPLLASGVVRAQGVPVAAIVAESTYAGIDGVDRLAIDYEPLAGVADADAALAPGAAPVVPVSRDNRALTVAWRHGDPDRAFREAAHHVTLTVQQQRLCGVPMEPRCALARWDADTDELTMWTSTQAPFRIRASLARMLGLDEARVRVIAPDVGGGFGVKGGPYREEVLVAAANRPASWRSTPAAGSPGCARGSVSRSARAWPSPWAARRRTTAAACPAPISWTTSTSSRSASSPRRLRSAPIAAPGAPRRRFSSSGSSTRPRARSEWIRSSSGGAT